MNLWKSFCQPRKKRTVANNLVIQCLEYAMDNIDKNDLIGRKNHV